MVRVRVTAPVRPSEDAGKVAGAVRNLFPDAEIDQREDRLVATSESLDRLEELLHQQRILDTARGVFLRAVAEDGTQATFRVAKQAAAAGHVSFSVGDSPLGDITVTVEDDHVEVVLRAVAPKTVKGFPVSEDEAARVEAKEKRAREAKKALESERKDGGEP